MATQLQIRRGTSTQVAAFTGAEGEIVVNTTNDSIVVSDGSTAGGFEMARADLNNVSDTSLNAALTGNTVSALTITTLTLGATAITATGTELNLLDGVTATTAELNYVDGVTSAIQTQIDTKAPLASPTFTGTVTADQASITGTAAGLLTLDRGASSNQIKFANAGSTLGYFGYLDGTGFSIAGSDGASDVVIDASGKVGIGTSTVNRALEIAGNNNGGAKANYIRITDTDTSATANNQQGGIEFFTNDVTAGISASMEVLYAGSGGGGEITFNTNASSSGTLTEALRIDENQNVLAGVTNAGATGLSLANSYNLSFSEGSNLSFANVFRQATSGATVIGSGYKYSSTGNKMASSHSSAWARTAISAGYDAIRFFADAEATIAVGTDLTPTEKMRITSAGVGIGTITPNATLEVASGFGNSDAGTNSPTIRITNDTQSSDWDPNDVIGTLEFQLDDNSGNAPYDAAFIKTVNDITNGTLASGALTFGTATYNTAGGAVERMRITSTGSARFNLSSTLSPESSNAYYPLFIGSSSQMARSNHPDYYWMSNGYYAIDGTYRAINNGHMVGTYTTGNGDYVFRVSSASVNAGSVPSWEETMKIDADGIVQKYKHPAFNAYNPAVTSTGNIIICGATRLNQGNNYSTTTGAFTAPVAGVYHFTFAILISAAGSLDYHRILFEINNSGTGTSYGDNLEEQAGNSYSSAIMSITIYLNKDDYIRIRNQGDETYGTSYGSFSGHLVG